ncbi:MAG: hypothetical protein ACI8W7_000361 [Gammaproteobacteria bacterium]|jgi:hypothetical protein
MYLVKNRRTTFLKRARKCPRVRFLSLRPLNAVHTPSGLGAGGEGRQFPVAFTCLVRFHGRRGADGVDALLLSRAHGRPKAARYD